MYDSSLLSLAGLLELEIPQCMGGGWPDRPRNVGRQVARQPTETGTVKPKIDTKRKWQSSHSSVQCYRRDRTVGHHIVHTANVGERDFPTGSLDEDGLEEVQQPSQVKHAVPSARWRGQSKE
jgi:hypothetical protein